GPSARGPYHPLARRPRPVFYLWLTVSMVRCRSERPAGTILYPALSALVSAFPKPTVRAGAADKGTGIMQLATLRTIDAHEAPSIAPGDRPIDLVHLARTTMGDRSLEREVLQLFERQATQLVGRMRTAAPGSIGMLAHTLKGSA